MKSLASFFYSRSDNKSKYAPALGLKQPDESQNGTGVGTPYKKIEAYIQHQMEQLNIPGVALAIVEGEKIVYRRGFGQAHPGGVAPTSQTPFFIGSLTKSFTALAVLQLVEAGKVELDAPVQRYLPWFQVSNKTASAEITVRHLLNQTSGLPTLAGEIALADFDSSPGAGERQARELATYELRRSPGTGCEYSNSNYSLLGLIIEAASGETYPDYLQKHIFAPLDMHHTYTSAVVARQNGLASGSRYWFGIPFPASNPPIPYGSLAAGLIISSAEDMAHYLIAHLNGGHYRGAQILSPAGIYELHHGAVEYRKMGISAGKYAMGWFESELGHTQLLWHGGTLPDFAAYMALLPGQNKGLVLLFNASHHWMTPVIAELGTGVAALLAGGEPTPVSFVGLIPWLLRGQLLLPAFQIGGVAATLRLLPRCHRELEGRPSDGRAVWIRHILLPIISNLLVALTLLPILGKRRGYLKLYMPDFYWVGLLCGVFSLTWGFVRTGLIFLALRKKKS